MDQFNTDYSLLSDYAIPPCWSVGLWRSWTRSTITDELAKKSGGNDLTAWHDRWLWPCLTRLRSGHYRTSCRDQHRQERSTAPRTDRSAIPAGA